jgi:uncharacterized protein YyaL (SSP411 family)
MKTLRAIFGLTALLFITSFKPSNTISWVGFNEGYTLAKKKNKIMLVDVYTDWCGWCKRMDRDTYERPDVSELVGKDFVAIKFNPEIEGVTYEFNGAKYSGNQLAGVISDYKLNGYPTTIFIYPKSDKKMVVVGYKNAEQMKEILNQTKVSLTKK